jgi:hypothetical protein
VATAVEVWAPEDDGARPRVVDGGPASGGEADGLGASSLLLRLLLGGVMLLCGAAVAPAAPATTATPTAALAMVVGFGAGAVPSTRLWWWRRVQQPVMGAVSQGEFLQGQIVLHVQEGGEGAGTPQ